MKRYLIALFLFLFHTACAQQRPPTSLTIGSWNIQNMGKSKSDAEIQFMANQIRNFDVVAIQEVATGPAGAQAVGRLGEALNRLGDKWDYTISDPTTAKAGGSERYAFMWKTSKLKRLGHAWLDSNYRSEIDREPYCIRLKGVKKTFTLVSFHAVPKDKHPETEIKYLRFLPEKYPDEKMVFCGDFNCPQSHNVFNPLKEMGYLPAFKGQKTTLRTQCKNNDCLASEYDNFYFRRDYLQVLESGIVPFYTSFKEVKEARQISDHLPVFIRVSETF